MGRSIIFVQPLHRKRGKNMRIANVGKSIGLVGLLLTSLMIGLVSVPTASAVNETSNGTIVTTETWSGTHTLTGDVTVAEGAKLVINAGTTINIPPGVYIDVEGAICAGSAACGASQGSASSQIRFEWATPADYSVAGRCYQQGNQLLTNSDAACGSGVIIRSTINQASTGFSYVSFNNAYGFPIYVQTLQSVQYGALIFEGSSTNADNLAFTNINTSNVIALDFAAPTIRDSTFTIGDDGRGYDAAAIRAYEAGAGILSALTITGSTFTGNTEAQCGNQGGGRVLIYAESSYVSMDNLEIKDNAYGLFFKGSSGSLGNTTIDVLCNAIDTNSYKTTGDFAHTLYLDNNIITTGEGAGITAYDGAIVTATRNTISGATDSSGFGIRDSTVMAHDNIVGPIGGYNGFWVYGQSEVEIENNTIQDTAKEPVQIGEYHYRDQGSNYPGPSPNRAYIANNIISNNSGTCNSLWMYGGDFPCPAIHVFTSSATILGNTITNNVGDGLRIKGSIVNVQDNQVEAGQFAANITHFDNKYGQKYGSIGYFSGNTWTNATQIYNISESRVTVQSEYIPDASGDYSYPVMLQWLGAECPFVQSECLLLPDTAVVPPRDMPLAIELVNNSTVFSFANLQNFDASKIHVQNQNSAWGSQVRQGELVRYQVKAQNSNVAGATVIIKDATGLPMYELTTDSFGFTQQVSLPSDFLLDRNWNHFVGETGVTVPGSNPTTILDEDTCSDGYDNDGDTFVDEDDPDCANGRELPFYIVEAYKFGKGKKDFDFVLSGSIDDVISLDNQRPSVTVQQYDGDSFAINAVITGTAWDGQPGPYPLDIIAYDQQFGMIERVEIQPPGSTDWYYAVDTSGANGELTKENHPFKTWSFDWDLSAHPDGESDVTFRIRSYDGLDYSPIEVRKFKLNLVPPTLYLNEPLDGSTHSNGKILFTGTASDPYSGTWGSDIQDIWFDVSGPNGYSSHFAIDGAVAWAYDWNFEELETGEYTFEVWASDTDFCDDEQGICVISTRTVTVLNDNSIPIVDLLEPDGIQPVRAETNTLLTGYASDGADGTITRVEIQILDLASGLPVLDGPDPVTSFTQAGPGYSWSAVWDTSKLVHERQYEIRVKAYDGEDYSVEDVVRITISKPSDANNIPPQFNSTNWPNQLTIFCVIDSNSENQCGGGAVLDLKQYFSDPDSSFDQLSIDFLDDQADASDDNHQYFITIDSEGFARYDPPTTQVSEDISSWTIENVRFVVRDVFDESAVSRDVTFFVQAIKFDVTRENAGESVSAENPAVFNGTGLPGARIEARSLASETLIKTVLVGETGSWTMELSLQDMNDASNELKFSMDGQTFGGSSEPASFNVVVGEVDDGSNLFLIIGIIVGALLLLGGVGYFFIEFEEIEDEGFATQEVEEEVDPYAWGKKEVAAIPQGAATVASQPVAVAQQPAAPQASAQHPGWMWDQETNQWVPDPNYQPPGQ